MKKRIVRITAALCAAALLAGCGSSIGSKDGGDYATEAAAQETAQKIIYNASLSMESTDFDTTREALMTAVEANGAWLESTSLYGTEKDHDRTADYTVRVPVGSYRAFLAAVGDAGSVLNISESAENITSSYIDVQARLSALEDREPAFRRAVPAGKLHPPAAQHGPAGQLLHRGHLHAGGRHPDPHRRDLR